VTGHFIHLSRKFLENIQVWKTLVRESFFQEKMVFHENKLVQLATSSLDLFCFVLMELGFELRSSCLQSRCFTT
jgi:hypothetical protein